MVLTLRTSYLRIFPVLSALAVLSLFTSIFFQIHLGEPADFYHVFDISFYHFVPLILWALYLPLIFRLVQHVPLRIDRFKRNLLMHVIISVAFAPIARLVAITVDFWIKSKIGMIDVPVMSVVSDVKWVILGSIPKELLTYWLVVLILTWLQNRNGAEESVEKITGKLILDTPSGSSIIPPEDILWVEAAGNYVLVHTITGNIRSRKTFKNISALLDHNFIQIHRSKIVNREAVSQLKHWRNGEYLIRLKNGSHITSTRTFLENVRKLTA